VRRRGALVAGSTLLDGHGGGGGLVGGPRGHAAKALPGGGAAPSAAAAASSHANLPDALVWEGRAIEGSAALEGQHGRVTPAED
jgi:hypothetical protein